MRRRNEGGGRGERKRPDFGLGKRIEGCTGFMPEGTTVRASTPRGEGGSKRGGGARKGWGGAPPSWTCGGFRVQGSGCGVQSSGCRVAPASCQTGRASEPRRHSGAARRIAPRVPFQPPAHAQSLPPREDEPQEQCRRFNPGETILL